MVEAAKNEEHNKKKLEDVQNEIVGNKDHYESTIRELERQVMEITEKNR